MCKDTTKTNPLLSAEDLRSVKHGKRAYIRRHRLQPISPTCMMEWVIASSLPWPDEEDLIAHGHKEQVAHTAQHFWAPAWKTTKCMCTIAMIHDAVMETINCTCLCLQLAMHYSITWLIFAQGKSIATRACTVAGICSSVPKQAWTYIRRGQHRQTTTHDHNWATAMSLQTLLYYTVICTHIIYSWPCSLYVNKMRIGYELINCPEHLHWCN